jgi:Carboxypeptidase regulatory-like domain
MLKTDNAGAYALPDLIPGAYAVRVSLQGFQTLVHSGIELGVGEQVRIDFALKPGTVAETVRVSGTPLIETTSNTLGGTLSSQQLVDLPPNGQDYENLVVLQLGVQRSPGGGSIPPAMASASTNRTIVWTVSDVGLMTLSTPTVGLVVTRSRPPSPDISLHSFCNRFLFIPLFLQ